MEVWSIWGAWQQIWINPWGWALLILGVWSTFRISWRARILPWAIAYILFTSIGYTYQSRNFSLAPSTMSSLLAVVSFLAFCALPEPKVTYRKIIAAIGLFGVACALSTLWVYKSRFDWNGIMPFFWNRSAGGSFIVLALAPTVLAPLGLISAVILARSTPLLVFGTYWSLEKKTLVRGSLCILAGAAILYFHGVPTGTGRLDIWKEYWHYWIGLPAATKIVGTHIGTTAALLPAQQALYSESQIYIWLHNDFFQALTELGILGFVLCAASGVEIFIKCSRRERAMALALCVGMAFNYPWHWMPEALVYWYWIKKNAVSNVPNKKSPELLRESEALSI